MKLDRRTFLKTSAAAALPAIVPSTVFGAEAPSNRVTMASIGVGNQGTNDLRGFLQDSRVQVVAVCDVMREGGGYWSGTVRGREVARKIVDEHYAKEAPSGTYKGCAAYELFEDVLGRSDIDAVEIAVPDHWHALLTVAAARAGKDIYCQKPLSLTIREGRAMVEAVTRYQRVFQCGSQQRSDRNFRRAAELVLNGRIGKLHTVRCGLPSGVPDYGRTASQCESAAPPDGFNYERWLGPAPWAPYCPARVGVNFRWVLDYSGGQLTDWGGHHPDCAQWGMGTELTGPVKIQNARAEWADHPVYNTATSYYFEAVYANGVKMIVSDRERGGVTFEGTDGWVWANRGRHDAHPKELLQSAITPGEIHLYESSNHFRNFIDCVLSRGPTVAPVEVAHRSITIAHLGNIAMRLGRDLNWDPAKECFVNDPQADRMLGRTMRSPWTV